MAGGGRAVLDTNKHVTSLLDSRHTVEQSPCHTDTMLISVTHLLLLSLHAVTAQLDLPKCWVHYGECLDDNQPPLNIQDIVKPLPNDNVIKIEKDVETIEDCKNKCEDVSSCTYYTLYKNDLNKNCQIVPISHYH